MINLNPKKFITVSVASLSTWVIWQFPHETGEGLLCGAIRSTEPESLWWPACIDADEQKIYLLAEAETLFTTPEEAALFLRQKLAALSQEE